MKIVLGNLPDGVEEGDVEALVEQYARVKSAEFLHGNDSDSGASECLVSLEDANRVAADVVVEKLNGYQWQGMQITARVLLFQNDTEPGET